MIMILSIMGGAIFGFTIGVILGAKKVISARNAHINGFTLIE